MEFLDLSSLGAAYWYCVKIDHKFKYKKRDIRYVNPNQEKSSPKPQNKGKIQGRAT